MWTMLGGRGHWAGFALSGDVVEAWPLAAFSSLGTD
jgi:hypothetical protein